MHLTALILFTSGMLSDPFVDTRTDSLIRIGIELSIRQRYEQAIEIFRKLEASDATNPVGFFFHAAVLQARMMDYEDYRDEATFRALIDTTIDLAKQRLRNHKNDPLAYFCLGGGYAYLAFYQAKDNRLIEAFRNGRRSVQALKAALRADSTLYDAYLGLGTYTYYRSKLSRHFAWLPFVGDDRAEGLRMLRLAIEKSRYSRWSAINGYFWIALEEGQLEEAERWLRHARRRFPESRVFLWCAAKLAVRQQRWHDAVTYFNQILESHRAGGTLRPYNELVCRKNLSQSYYQLGDYARAQEQCRRLQKIQLDAETLRRHPDVWKEVERVCDQLVREVVTGAGLR